MINYDIVVVGAGQAGLAIGYYLKQAGISYVLIDEKQRIGDSWRHRYDSLVLFTPRKYSSLPGLEMSGCPEGFPTKDEMANYLEAYADHFNLSIKLNTLVKQIDKKSSLFEITTNQEVIKTKEAVIATGAFQKPFIPSIKAGSDDGILHIHSSNYVSPNQIPDGSVLVVGGGNSGAQIAVELAQERDVSLAISHPLKFLPLRFLGKSIFKWLDFVGLLYAGLDTKRGRWFQKQSDPIFGYDLKKLINEGKIKIKDRVMQVTGKEVVLQNEEKQYYETIIWATGFVPNYEWINIDGAISSKGEPIHTRGESPIKGLYFIGLPWQYQRGSALICGVGRDAEYLMPNILHEHFQNGTEERRNNK